MDDPTKELEKVTRLIQIAEESLSQIQNKLGLLTSSQEVEEAQLAGLWSRASLLQGSLATLEKEHQALIHSRV